MRVEIAERKLHRPRKNSLLQKYRQGGLAELLTIKTAPSAPTKIQGAALEKLQQPDRFEQAITAIPDSRVKANTLLVIVVMWQNNSA